MIYSDGKHDSRSYQTDALNWVDSKLDKKNHVVLHAPVGSGKSLCLRALQRAQGGLIVTPNNVLIDQYVATYPELNAVIGKGRYRCKNLDMPCATVQVKYKCNPLQCAFVQSRYRFDAEEDSISNFMMTHFLYKEQAPQRVYVDEAHTIISSVRQMTNKTILYTAKHRALFKKHGIDPMALGSDFEFKRFLDALLEEAQEQNVKDPSDANAMVEYELFVLKSHFLDRPEQMVRIPEPTKLTYFSVFVSKSYMRTVIGNSGVLTSGTLLKHDLNEILGADGYEEYSIPSVIPAKQRGVILSPSPFKHNQTEMDPEKLADRIIETFNVTGLNAVCHVTYSLAKLLVPYLEAKFKGNLFAYTDTKTKKQTVSAYCESADKNKHGNLLVGAGIVEGLDLKDDLARVNIITKLLFPNLGDPFIRKRMSLPDGKLFYAGETIKNMLQAIGRTTRGPNDRSVTVILDNNANKLITDGRKLGLITKDFDDSLLFSENEKKEAFSSL